MVQLQWEDRLPHRAGQDLHGKQIQIWMGQELRATKQRDQKPRDEL